MNIYEELETHTHVEETVIYPSFRNFPEFSDLLKSSYEEHARVRKLLNSVFDDLRSTDGRPDQFVERVEAIEREVMAHVRTEETEFFPRVRHQMKRREREQLGRHVQAAKDERRERAA